MVEGDLIPGVRIPRTRQHQLHAERSLGDETRVDVPQRDENGRSWLLTIVRNVCLTRRKRNPRTEVTPFDEETHSLRSDEPGPERAAHARQTAQRVRRAVAELPDEFREVIVLRELEELSYKEIADVLHVPAGTVMSRLNRGRARLRELLSPGEERG
jgi:RNA polymerase sigma-70 factor (ECF subfamily)